MDSSSTISILDFPSEITAEIFWYSFEVELSLWVGPEALPQLTPYLPPLIFGCICRQWRNIAFSTPKLWNHVVVHCGYFIEDSVPYLDRWLARTGTLPITMDLKYRGHPDTSSDDLLGLMKRHSQQMQTLTLDISPDDFYRFPEVVGPLNGLKKLVLNSRIMSNWMYDGSPISAFSIAPELRDVHFISGFSTKNITLPWAQLTAFRADTLPTSLFLLVLSLAPNLVDCRFEIYHALTPATVVVSVPPLLHLKSLNLRGMIPSTDVLAHLTTPALVHLEVEALELERWTSFLSRSQCSLQYLAVATNGWTPDMYIQMLDRVPSVTELVGRRGGPSFYNLFSMLKRRPQFLPNLKIFYEDQNYCLDSCPKLAHGAALCLLIIEMLENRRGTEIARLERFELYTTRGLVGSAQLLGRLNALVNDGMEIFVEGSESWGH